MLPLELFRNPTYTGANLVVLLVALAMFGVFFFMSLYMQQILGYSAVQTGAAFLPMTVLIILVAPIAGKTSDRIGSRGLMTAGMVLIAVQLLYFSRLGLDATFWDLLPAFLVGGVGMALTMTPSAAAATRSVPVDKAGVGSAVLNASRQVGGSLGIAIIGAIMAYEAGGERTPQAFIDGFQSGAPRRRRDRRARRGRRVRARPAARGRRRARRAHGVDGAGRVTTPAGTRLPAAERRRAIVEAALRVFSEGSYAGATTAQIAREAGVSEPILYRHFASKRDLYFACLDEAWRRIRDAHRGERSRSCGAAEGWRAIGPGDDARDEGARPEPLDAGDHGGGRGRRDPPLRPRATCARCTTSSRTSSGACRPRAAIHPDRDPDAEAWIFVAGSLLVSIADRLGGPSELRTSRRSSPNASAG